MYHTNPKLHPKLPFSWNLYRVGLVVSYLGYLGWIDFEFHCLPSTLAGGYTGWFVELDGDRSQPNPGTWPTGPPCRKVVQCNYLLMLPRARIYKARYVKLEYWHRWIEFRSWVHKSPLRVDQDPTTDNAASSKFGVICKMSSSISLLCPNESNCTWPLEPRNWVWKKGLRQSRYTEKFRFLDKRVRKISRFFGAPPRVFPLSVCARPRTVLSTNTSTLV